MYTDAELRPSQAQSVVGAAGNYVSTNTIDLLAAVNNQGRGRPRRAYAVMTTALAGATNIKAQYIQSANADLSSPDVLIDGPVVAAADAVAGAVLMTRRCRTTPSGMSASGSSRPARTPRPVRSRLIWSRTPTTTRICRRTPAATDTR